MVKPKSHIESKSASDEQEELSAIVRSIKLSNKYYLYFVACNQTPRQNELIAEVKAKLPQKDIEVIKFKKPIVNLLSELKPLLKDKKPDAIFVQCLENSITSDGIGKENALIHSLNLTRDAFNDALPCPMYLWIPEYALIKMTRHAPDFFSVRSGIFYFSSPAKQVIADIFQNTSTGWVETSSLPIAEKQKRIANLESLLAEYQGLHKEKRDRQAELRLKENLGDLFYSISNYRKALKYSEDALEISREIGDRQGEGSSLGNLGIAYRNLGDYQKALKYFEDALNIAREIGDRHGEGNHLGNLGNAYISLGGYQKAIKYFEDALNIAREIGDRQGEGNHLGNLGNAYDSLGDYQKAIKYHEDALEISREIGNRHGEGSDLGNLGNAYISLGDYQKAIKYFEDALNIAREIGDQRGEGSRIGNLGIAYISLGDYQKALKYFEDALNIVREIGDRQGEGNQLGNLGIAYRNLGEKDKAREYNKQALAIFEAIHSPNAGVIRQNLAIIENEL